MLGSVRREVVVCLGLWLSLGLAAGCRGRDGDETASLVATLRARPGSPLEAGVAERFDAVPGGLAPRFPAAMTGAERTLARVTLPPRATAPVLLQHAGSAVAVTVSLVGALAAEGRAADGYVVYPKALASGATVLHRALPTGSEDFVSFETPPREPAVSYELGLGADVAGLRLVAGTLELLDRGGAPRLRVAPPFIVGADGVQTDATLAVEGCAVDTSPSAPWGRAVTPPGATSCTMRIRWPETGVKYPALLDPRWTTTGSMTSARQDHTATFLPLTGKVLVVGGRTSGASTTGLASAELYDKSTGTWAATSSLSGGRWSHTATLLNASSNATTSQRVLVSGGINGTTSLATAQLYDQTAGTWAAAANLNAARHLHTATLLADGRVLAAGGMNGTAVLQTAALYNPSSGAGSWTATTGPIPPPGLRSGTATLIQTANTQLNNKVLLAGGNDGTKSVASVFLFDPAQSAFSTLASMPGAREGHAAVVLSTSKILFAGGKNGSTTLATALIFDPGSGPGSWSTTGSLTSPRWGHAMNLLPAGIKESGQVLVSGGSNGSSTLSSTEVWNGSAWAADGAMVAPVQQHAAVVVGNNILIAGGVNGSTTVNAAELYDPSLGLACTSGSQCASGFCVGGVCCDSACNGGCGACNLAGKVGVCSPVAAGTGCRAAAGVCDVAESCNGTSVACPADGFAASTTVCRGANGACDLPETCTGTGPACPGDAFQPSSVVCRASAGQCDVAESCTGAGPACPTDGFVANGSRCDDGNACTDGDACQAGACAPGTPRTCVASDQCHVGSCDPSTGVCSSPPAPDGTACNDGSLCTQTDSCQAGACVGGNPVTCPASDQCHAPGSCDPGTGACVGGSAVADFTPCSDGDLCTRAKACQGGVCTGGQSACEDGDPCTTDSCDAATGACAHDTLTGDACTVALAAAPPLQGRVDFETQPDNNRCVPDPAHVINRLNAQGELMAWHYDHAGYAALDGEHFHTETMIRMPYRAGTPLDGSIFVSAWSHPPDSGLGAVMGVAKLQFKHGNHGKVLGTNRAFNGVRTLFDTDIDGNVTSYQVPAASDWFVTPNPGDSFMPLGSQGTPGQVLHTVQTHPGGGSALGSHVTMGLQGFDDACACSFLGITFPQIDLCGCTLNSSQPIIQVWDLVDPLAPVLRSSFLSHINTTDADILAAAELNGQAGTSAVSTAITKLASGHFLLAVLKDSPSRVAQYEFYLSTGTSLDDPQLFGTDNRLPNATAPFGHPNSAAELSSVVPDWQSFNFMTGCDGSLWVIGTRGDASGFPDGDAVDNYRVYVTHAGSVSGCTTPLCVSLRYAADVPTMVRPDFYVLDAEGTKHMFCPDNSGTDQCDMASGAGSYIGPNGEVIIYSSDYDDDGGATSYVYGNGTPFCTRPDCNDFGSFSGYIRGKEFHERHGNGFGGSACPTLADAWVELYENANYNSFGDDTGQIYRLDYPSREERNSAFGYNDFDGKASSVRWCIPVGSSFVMYDGNLTGSSVVLNGTGKVAEIPNFNQADMVYPHGGGGLNDSITSGKFQANVVDSQQGLVGTPDPAK